jgi:3-aminobutyryl-CoA ammonia-lyase
MDGSDGVFLRRKDRGGLSMAKFSIRLRMNQSDAHYGGNLVDGARLLALLGDVATYLLIERDGDEGLFRAYTDVQFLAPVYAGEFLEAEGEIVAEGNSSRTMEFSVKKIAVPLPDVSDSAAEVLDEPIVVLTARGVCVTPVDRQRLTGD